MARKFAEDLHLDIAIVDKRRVNGRSVEVNALIGDVKGKEVILVDDICSTGSTLETAAQVCKEEGAKTVFAVVTHGLLLGGTKLKGIDQIFVTNTIPAHKEAQSLKIVTVAPLFAEAIDCVISAKSISSMFKKG